MWARASILNEQISKIYLNEKIALSSVKNRFWKGEWRFLYMVKTIFHDYYRNSIHYRPWLKYKRQNLEYADRLQILKMQNDDLISAQRLDDVYKCGTFLDFLQDANGNLYLDRANFCKDRFCALCQWRRTLKMTFQSSKVIEKSIQNYPSSRFIFLTLTLKNVKGDKLRETVQNINRAFSKIMRRKIFDSLVVGYLRATEVTVNRDDMTYHPHLHVLLQVQSSYFKGNNYISQKKWKNLWKETLNLDYEPMVNVQAIKPNSKGDSSIDSALKEVSKYQTKPTTYLSSKKYEDVQIIKTLRTELKGLRMLSYGKQLKDIKSELFPHDGEGENEDLINVEDKTEALNDAQKIAVKFDSQLMNYVIIKDSEKL